MGTHAVVLTNTITDNNEGGPQTFTATVSFNVIIEDPCDTSVITPIGLTPQPIVNGATYEWTFTEAVIAIEVANEGQKLCGAREYKVYMPGPGAEVTGDWITITETPSGSGTYKLLASPIDDALVTGSATQLVLRTTLPTQSHPPLDETLSISVTAATCDCNLITWDNPAAATLTIGVGVSSGNTVTIPEAAINVPSQTAVPAIRVCAINPATTCGLSYTSSLIDVS